MTRASAAVVILAALLAAPAFAQAPVSRPVTIGKPMPDFTLPAYQGGDVTLSKLRGKIVLVVFPRGFAAEGRWCSIDNYQHAELADFDRTQQFRTKDNVEILYIFPYGKDQLDDWLAKYPAQLASIETRKNPPDQAKLDEEGQRRVAMAREVFPKTFTATEGRVLNPFPILLDPDRTVAKGLGLFTTEWGGSKVDQDIPSTFIIDQKGILQFKYVGQNTVDRPPLAQLVKVIDGLAKAR